MSMSIIPADKTLPAEDSGGWLERATRKIVLGKLAGITTGELIIRENEQVWCFGKPDVTRDDQTIFVDVRHAGFWTDVALNGTTGAGEAYINGRWSCNNLVALTRLMIRNSEVLYGMDSHWTRLKQPVQRFIHLLRRNTKSGSRRNIGAHYDVGNRFFSLFLDPTMMYSSAIFAHSGQTLHQASVNKLDHVCTQLELGPDDHLLEIGTGWGGMAIHAAKNYGCRVTTTTLSREQYEWASIAVEEAGLQDKVTLLMKDYRELEGTYSKLVSIEMIEAIGHQYMDTYFKQCRKLLEPGGKMLIQAITIKDQLYRRALKDADFIKTFIFPGGFLPSITAMSQSMTKVSDLSITAVEDIGLHYATTLYEWRKRFLQRLDEVREQGYPESFIRMWDFYFCYCEGGFRQRYIRTVQMVIE